MEKQKELLGQLVREEILPKNEFVGYLVEKAQMALVELDQAADREKRALDILAENRQQQIRLRSTLDAYAMDIMHWQEKGDLNGRENGNTGDDASSKTPEGATVPATDGGDLE